ncbi:restriction endonuclease subunit S [Paracoccus lutimaris]|uniref:Type I restriction enzyme S subunit n=1 Tax=Paracoccus lutimaris TaxID=1490030 RepID=A0A368Z8M6_9RHOB|nr:restriction endonuclease subunit S [Paracoccus lutimaris]RCW88805.1 type I restriction enzyme S subunit [Paracoccus lutimaris]
MSVWPTVSIESIAEKIAMGPFGSNIKVETFVPQGVPVISGQHLHGTRLNDAPGFNYVTAEHAERLRNSCVKTGDIIFTHAGTIGQVALIPESATYAQYIISQRQFYLRVNRDLADPAFITRWFHAPCGHHRLMVHASQVGVPSISRPASNLRQIQIELPPLEIQREISTVLDGLDDKIEVNRKASATLEEMARALYRSWFVDFDPVWAKLEGGQPAHMDAATAALFPDSFDNDGLPLGWRSGKLSDVAVNPRNGVKPEQISPETAYIGLEHMPRRSITLPDWGTAADVGSQKSGMCAGDFLFGKLRPYFHKVGIAPVDGICSTDIIVVRPKTPEWAGFVLSIISTDEFVEHTNAGSSGTRMPRTNWSDMGAYEITMPPGIVASAYDATTKPWRDRIVAGVHENRTLAALRDTLLPRLMSGELRVGEARELVEEVA